MTETFGEREATGRGAGDAETRSAAVVAIPAALLCAVLTVMLLVDAGGATRTALGLVVVLGGVVALGPLLLLTPVEPSPLKLGLFAALLGPPFVGAVAAPLMFGVGLEPGAAWAVPIGLGAVCALLASRRRIGAAPPGRAAWASLLIGGAAAGLAVFASWTPGGLHERLVSPACVAHMTLADTIGRGAPLVNPWLAGGVLDVRPAPGAFLAAVCEPAGLSAVGALAILRGWALLVIAVTGYLAAAAAFRERSSPSAGARDMLAAALAVTSLALGPSLVALVDLRPPRAGWYEEDPAALLARAYAFAAFLAGLHAIRRGARPWPSIAALLVAVAALMQPWIGLSVAVALACAAIVTGRLVLASALLASLLPGFALGRMHGGFVGDQVARFTTDSPGVSWAPLAVLIASSALLFVRRADAQVSGEDRAVARRGSLALALGIAVPIAIALVVSPARWDAPALGAFALLPASLAAAAGLAGLARRALGLSLGSALLLIATVAAGRSAVELARADEPIFDETAAGLRLTVSDPLVAGLGDAFTFLEGSALALERRVALLRGGVRTRSADGGDLPSIAPLLAGIGLWSDVAPPPGSRQPRFGAGRARATGATDLGDSWVDRKELLDALFRKERGWSIRFDRVLGAETERGTTLVFIVTEADRRRTTDRGEGPRGTDSILKRLGAEPVFQRQDVIVYVLEGSPGG